MHKRAFQGLKRTFMHVSGLPPSYFDNKTKKVFSFVIKIMAEYLAYSFQNARLCMFQVLLSNKWWWEKT